MFYRIILKLLIVIFSFSSIAVYAAEHELANDMATLFRSARAVISQNQAHINNPDIGNKGLSSEKVIAKAKENFLAATGRNVDENNLFLKAELEAIGEVMDDAQDLINEKGKGLKGFLPAIFAKSVADKTSKKLDGRARIKLTAPIEYVRNRGNRPDKWEHEAIEKYLATMTVEKNEPYKEVTKVRGVSALRFILPEFYKQSCLACHGDPKGELDITGGKKEGGKLGELGGAISIILYK